MDFAKINLYAWSIRLETALLKRLKLPKPGSHFFFFYLVIAAKKGNANAPARGKKVLLPAPTFLFFSF